MIGETCQIPIARSTPCGESSRLVSSLASPASSVMSGLLKISRPLAGLDLVDTLTDEPSLVSYHLLPSVRGDLLFRLGRAQEALAEFERAATLTRNARERELLLERARACEASASRA